MEDRGALAIEIVMAEQAAPPDCRMTLQLLVLAFYTCSVPTRIPRIVAQVGDV
jgi:hypothetical protein